MQQTSAKDEMRKYDHNLQAVADVSEHILTLIWVGILGVRFKAG